MGTHPALHSLTRYTQEAAPQDERNGFLYNQLTLFYWSSFLTYP